MAKQNGHETKQGGNTAKAKESAEETTARRHHHHHHQQQNGNDTAAHDPSADDQKKKRDQTPTNGAGTNGAATAHRHQITARPPFSPWTTYLTSDRTAAAGPSTPAGDVRTPRGFDFSGLGLTPRAHPDDSDGTFDASFASGLFPYAPLSPFHAGTPSANGQMIHRMGSQDSACPSESEAFQSLLHASDALFGTAADPRHAEASVAAVGGGREGGDGASLRSLSTSVTSKKKRGRPRKNSATAKATSTTKKTTKYSLPTGNITKKAPAARKKAGSKKEEQSSHHHQQQQHLPFSGAGHRPSRSSRGVGDPSLNPHASPRSPLGRMIEPRDGGRSTGDSLLRQGPTGPPSVRRTFQDGEYEGQIVGDGRRHGYGVMQFVNGDKYVGWWNDDVMDGMGRMKYSDG